MLAEQITDELAVDAHDRGTRFGQVLSSLLRAEIEARRGALLDLDTNASIALALTQKSGHTAVASVAAANLCVARFERGAYDAATAVLREVELDDGDVPPDALFTPLLSARGRLWLALAQPRRALVDLHECGARRERLESRNPVLDPWRGPAALAHRALGEVQMARRLAAEDVDAARSWGTPAALGSTLRVWALTGDGTGSIETHARPSRTLDARRLDSSTPKALVDLGLLCGAATDARTPWVVLIEGLDLADRCAALALALRAREELAALGVRPRRARLTGAEALTASELRVARLAAGGLSNVEIAEQLFVSRKTVEKHLGNAYEKLGVNSRAALSPHLSSDHPDLVGRRGRFGLAVARSYGETQRPSGSSLMQVLSIQVLSNGPGVPLSSTASARPFLNISLRTKVLSSGHTRGVVPAGLHCDINTGAAYCR